MFKIEVLTNIFDGILLFLSKHCILQPKVTVRFCPNSDQKYHGIPGARKELEKILNGQFRDTKKSHIVSVTTTQLCHSSKKAAIDNMCVNEWVWLCSHPALFTNRQQANLVHEL